MKGGVAAWSVAAAILAVVGHHLLFTSFTLYDDEGYVLIALKHVLDGAPLYEEVFSQYGPWSFLHYRLLLPLVGGEVGHDSGRWMTLIHWVVAALSAGGIAERLSGSRSVGITSAAASFAALWQMTVEPGHPGSQVAALCGLAVLAAVHLLQHGREAQAAGVMGVAGALLVLTKVNVGLLFGASVAAFLLSTCTPRRFPGRMSAGVLLVSMPWVLVHASLPSRWVWPLAISFGLAASLVLAWIPEDRGRAWKPRCWIAALGGGGATLLAVLLWTAWNGTGWAALVDGILLAPLRHPSHFAIPLAPTTVGLVLLLLVGGMALARGNGAGPPWWSPGVLMVRTGVAVAFLFGAPWLLTVEGLMVAATVVLPLLPFLVVPLGDPMDGGTPGPSQTTGNSAPLLVASLVAGGQVLHLYPVAGSQLGWGMFLLVPLFAVGVVRGLDALKDQPGVPDMWPRMLGRLLVIAVGLQVAFMGVQGYARWRSHEPLDLPGATRLRLPEPVRTDLRILTANAAAHGEVLFSLPGLFSFNLWSGVPTPTRANATHWFWLLDADEQERIRVRMDDAARPAIIRAPRLEDFLRDLGVPVDGALVGYMHRHFRPLVRFRAFELLVAATEPAVPLGMLAWRSASTGEPGDSVLLEGHVLLPDAPGSALAVTLRVGGGAASTLESGAVLLQPVNPAGEALAAPLPLAALDRVGGVYRLEVTLSPSLLPAPPPGEGLRIDIRDVRGRSLAELRMADPAEP